MCLRTTTTLIWAWIELSPSQRKIFVYAIAQQGHHVSPTFKHATKKLQKRFSDFFMRAFIKIQKSVVHTVLRARISLLINGDR